MCSARAAICVLIAPCLVWCSYLQAQASKAKNKAASRTTTVLPTRVDLLSLQVSKLPRNEFGQGIKPGANETIAFWLANSGTAVDLRLKLDRLIAQFDEKTSRLLRFADDRGGDLTQPPRGEQVNTFFPENKPFLVKLGPKPDEAEVILRGFGTPAPGATKLQIHADLVFLAGAGEQTAERKGLQPTPGSRATIGPLQLRFKDPQQAGPFGGFPRTPGADVQNAMQVAFDYQRLEKPIKSVACLNPEGKQVATLEGSFFNGEQGGTVSFGIPKMTRIHLRVVYFEKTGTITVPVRVETGMGF
jgi:hypothetical protein